MTIAAGLVILVLAASQSPAPSATPKPALATATFAGGCFWCMEEPFDRLPGVKSTTSGYTGGAKKNPTYEEVSAGVTGHAEAVQVRYDPSRITYEQLLDVFWHNIDPFSGGGQFCDRGSQYRPGIYFHDAAQKEAAEKSMKAVADRLKKPLAVELQPASTYYAAEEYHQDFYKKSRMQYLTYRQGCGRDRRLKEIWGTAPH